MVQLIHLRMLLNGFYLIKQLFMKIFGFLVFIFFLSIKNFINLFKVQIQQILHRQINYFYRILKSIFGNFKLFIHLYQKQVQVH
jgi:hypothetical protein